MTEKRLYALNESDVVKLTKLAKGFEAVSTRLGHLDDVRLNRGFIASLVPVDRQTAVERMARVLADLELGEPWPTNEELGGGPTGTRDDEYRHECMDRARAALDALLQEDE